jgi:hypothetical protein
VKKQDKGKKRETKVSHWAPAQVCTIFLAAIMQAMELLFEPQWMQSTVCCAAPKPLNGAKTILAKPPFCQACLQ